MSTTRAPTTARKALTALDHRVEAATGRSVDQLWEHRDRGLLDEPHRRLVDAHRSLAQAETSVTYHRVLLHRLSSGGFPVEAALFARIDRTVDQLKQAAVTRDERQQHLVAVLEPLETAAREHASFDGREMTAPDVAALLAIAQGAKLHEHLLTQRLSVVTASGTRLPYSQLQRLEDAGLVQRDTSHPVHAGQPVTLTDAGRAALPGSRRTSPPAVPGRRAGAWPVPQAAHVRHDPASGHRP
ncbi:MULTISPECIES: hypothetical protein [Streptomyces]|uniref:hypothetical protein n=1 Tax=Streptomyces TaxID=1883 RepID=UPI00163C77C5|nr:MULTISPECIES: hypothetical protein [Streptomyces]MBC2878080.1 hypothetical protein [Streptomyces sp. TYQ1024]UBI40028.1 hypothetical protein K7I03_28575 [Streptomyces mobaraensis]UKW32608.1 hypothetical protein MCU78_28505 [Streptomyces sp. TYQ1024]